jgi:hypothetical protein
MKKNTKAIFYTVDALFASILLIGAVLLIYSAYTPEDTSIEQQTFVSQDILTILSELKISELNSSFVNQEITSGNITDINKTVLDQIGEYWALNKVDKAQLLLQDIINTSMPENYGIKTTMGNNTLLLQNLTTKINSVASNRMISGIEQGKPLLGSSGTSYLKKINDKKTSSYIYFGGFVGQGNITKFFDLKNISVIKIILEVDVAVGGTFELKINNNFCNSSTGVKLFTPSSINMTSDLWDITSCSNYLTEGKNNFTFLFTNLGDAYISGGYVKIDYAIDEFQESSYSNYTINSLPGIDGAVNLYDSFYVPGELNNLDIYLHYKINTSTVQNTFFMNIGNTTVFLDNFSNGEVKANLSDINFSMLNYASLNSSTIPIRIGFENITLQTIIVGNGEGFGDIVVTTDVSGSMDWRFDSSSNGIYISDCSDPSLYATSTSRISVARCVDKIFVDDVLLNNTLNRIGLVTYSDNTQRKFNLTNNQDALNTEINTYSASGSTCISCGISDAYNLLLNLSAPQLHKDVWKYDLSHEFISPDSNWYILGYDDISWSSGTAPFGYKVLGVNTILDTNNISANLWEYRNGSYNDVLGAPNDFTSGKLNNTANTYGLNATGNDGWDNKTGVYDGNSTGVTMYGISSYGGNNKLRINMGGPATRQISDGSYGIQFNVTDEMLDVLNNGGYAVVSFEYRWVDTSNNRFESSDQAWIKARLTNTSGNIFYLGTQLDSSHIGSDSTLDIAAVDTPDNDISGTFSQDITLNITSNGQYYLDFGCKVSRDVSNEIGECYFDNVQVTFVSSVGDTYYRNIFSMFNLTRFSDAYLYISSDNSAEIYLNGNLIDNDTANHTRSYWNRVVSVSMSNFVEGDNILAAKLKNKDTTSGFLDLELRANMTGRQNAILIMSDGDANQCIRAWNGDGSLTYCNDCSGRACCPNVTTGVFNSMCPDIANLGGSSDGNETAFEQVINISCYLHNNLNISMYSVAFGTASSVNGTKTLNLSAACDNVTHFYTTTNVSAIAQIYQDIASSIVSGFSSRESQAMVFTGGSFAESTLYPDSYIAYNYTSIVEPPIPGEIEVSFESSKFNGCNQTIIIPQGVRVLDAKITSYSGQHWTDYLSIDNIEVYNLSKYDSSYLKLGDPFIIQIPPSYLNSTGTHYIVLKTGDDPNSNTNCSTNNSFIYTALIPSTISRSEILPKIVGCTWIVESENNDNTTIKIPSNYAGSKTCYYTNSTQTFNSSYEFDDAYDLAVYQIFRQLDIDNNGKIIVSLASEDLEVVVLTVGGLPYMWGPSMLNLEVWQ